MIEKGRAGRIHVNQESVVKQDLKGTECENKVVIKKKYRQKLDKLPSMCHFC